MRIGNKRLFAFIGITAGMIVHMTGAHAQAIPAPEPSVAPVAPPPPEGAPAAAPTDAAATQPPPAPGTPAAQPAPAPPPPSSAPAPVPLAPAPPPQPSFGMAPAPTPNAAADTAKPKENGKKPASGGAALGLGSASNPFRLSWFNWTHNVSAKMVGVGSDYISNDDEVYSWDFSVTPRYSFISTKTDWAWVGLNIPWTIELTNSDATTERNEAQFGDIALQSAYNRTLVRTESGLSVLAGPRAQLIFPTSPTSSGQGRYLTTVLGVGGNSTIPFHDGTWFSGVFVTGGLSWQHLFSRSNVPTNPDVHVPRQTFSSLSNTSDVLTGTPFARNTLAMSLGYFLDIVGGLSLGNSYSIQVPFRAGLSTVDCVQLSTGCADVAGVADTTGQAANDSIPIVSFDLSLNYTFYGLVNATLGYNNTTRQLGADGQRRVMFYSPDANFYFTTSVFLDTIYMKLKPKAEEKTATAQAKPSSL